MLEALIGKQIGQLLANCLYQFGFRDMVMDETGDAVNVP